MSSAEAVTFDIGAARQQLVDLGTPRLEELLLKTAEIEVDESAINPDGTGAATVLALEGGETFKFTDLGIMHLSAVLGIPSQYLLKCPPSLQRANLEYWQTQVSDRKYVNFVIGQGNVQAVTSRNFVPVSNVRVFDRVKELVSGGADADLVLDLFEHSWQATRFSFSSGKRARHLVENAESESFRLGVNVVNSLTNSFDFELELSIQRVAPAGRYLVPAPDDARYRFRNDGTTNLDAWLGETVGEMAARHTHLVSVIQKAAATKFQDARQVLEDELAANAPGPLRDDIAAAWEGDPLPSPWGVAGAFTRATQDIAASQFHHRLQVERFAGKFVTDPDVCNVCGRAGKHKH